MSKESKISSQDDFNAWKSWIEEKASYILSFAVNEQIAKEYVTYISGYVTNYLYPENSNESRAAATSELISKLNDSPSPAVNNSEFQDLISSLQNPPHSQLLLTNFAANPEKYSTIDTTKNVETPEIVTTLHNEIISNAIDKAIEEKRLPKKQDYGLKMSILSDQESFESLQALKKDWHAKTVNNGSYLKTEDQKREERINEYKDSQSRAFSNWDSIPEGVKKDLKEKREERIADEKERETYGEGRATISASPDFSNVHYSSGDVPFENNPLILPKNEADKLKERVKQQKIDSVALPNSAIKEETKKPKQHEEVKTQQEFSINQLSDNPKKSRYASTSSIPDYKKDPFTFLPKKQNQTQATSKEPSKWEKERLEKLTKTANLSNEVKENISYSGNVSEVGSQSTAKVKDIIKQFKGGRE